MATTSQFKVTATALNLRSEPVIAPRTVKATLPQGQLVTKVGGTNGEIWWKVSTTLHGVDVEGFVSRRYLSPVSDIEEPVAHTGIGAVHLTTANRIARNHTGGRAYPLNETGQPRRNGTTAAAKAAQLTSMIEWLKVEQSQRYLASGGATFCNIYAYDYCYLAGVYLPRVWWTRNAIARLASGASVTPQYDVTVSELNANSLCNWFEEFGSEFGWQRVFSLNQLQRAANDGQVCIINGQRTNLNRSGHICAVVPETAGHQALRSGAEITTPLQSQAGASNFRYGGRVWWTSSQFRKFGFWVHE
ncbi:MAG: hypothetical protein HY231_12750 [Acidobacteria bacterium]|nr:hypothetical protein [Acidobacteriota bacterium]